MQTEHLLTLDEICARYTTSVDTKKPTASKGLTSDMAAERLKTVGPNIMTPPKQVPLVLKYLLCLGNLFNTLLIVSGVLCFIVYGIDPEGNPSNV